MLCLLTVLILFLGALGQTEVEKVSLEGYPVETHNVTTKDDYILQIVRIPYGKNSKNKSKGVVFLMHGILCSFNSFTYLGSDYGIVLAATNKHKLHYVGHSQGGAVFLILNSMKPAYQSKFASANLLSGNGYATDFPNKFVKTFCGVFDVIYTVAVLLGDVEFKPTSIITKTFAEILVNSTVPPNLIAGAAVKQATHYCQVFRDKKFRRFNYGAGNFLKYGTSHVPPSYDLTKIQVNTTFYYSLGDITQSETDVLLMTKDMLNARAHKVARTDFDHMDYLRSTDVKELVTNYIIESIGNS